MKLLKLTIEQERYGTNRGAYTGTAAFTGETGTIQLHLNEHHIQEIFRTCSESIVDVARAAARQMTCAVIEQKNALERTHD